MRRTNPENPWENTNFLINNAVSFDGFFYLKKVFYEKLKSFNDKYFIPKSKIEEMKQYEILSPLYFEVSLYHNLMQIIACTTIESVVNSFGIHVFSEAYYKENMERNPIVTKIKLLIAYTNKIELNNDDLELKKITKLFDKRNSLVHPKAKKITNKNMGLYAIDYSKCDDKYVKDLVSDFEDIMSFLNEQGIIFDFFYKIYKKKKK